MKLVKAEPTDFAFCNELYEDYDCDMIYRTLATEEKAEEVDFFLDEETIKNIEEELKLTEEKFEKLIADRNEKVLIITDRKRKIGCMFLFRIQSKRWKLAFFQLKLEYQTSEIVHEILDALMKQSGISVIDVCAMNAVENLYLEAGFKNISKVYLRREEVR